MFNAKVYISLKEGVADPQGATIKHALDSLGFKGVNEVKTGKYFQIELNIKNKREAEKQIEDMCKKILVNPVIEKYEYEIEEIKR
ncbi:phosphoribosylformylglycinamidine synthase subunit PurS [Candidatus Aerophobetes bacterium]|nr:phosphoribosylformylglycinamidine synthase subunit PurS [Candidatus Aerophobetes bacterium]